MNGKAKKSIKTRIFKTILVLIIIIFSIIAVSFNILAERYIDRSSNLKLNEIKNMAQRKGVENPFKGEFDSTNKAKGLNHFKKIVEGKEHEEKSFSDSKVMIINENYDIIAPCSGESEYYSISEYEQLAESLRNKEIDLDSDKNIKIDHEENNNTYYISVVKIDEENDYYLVAFMNITSLLKFERSVNAILICIMIFTLGITTIIAGFLSKKISRPIQKLSMFAKQIGKGNFNQCSFDFEDSELDELASVMNKAANELDKYDREQKVFFQNVSHELRTPLMSIKGYAEGIKYQMIENDEAADIILEEGNRLEELIEELLYMSKMDNITKDYVKNKRDLREVLSDCAIKERSIAVKNSIEIIYDFDDEPVIFECEEKSLYRAFINIIDNGLRYAESSVIIRCNKYKDKIIISIENDGEFIDEKDMPHIFERFYKGSKGKNGIGLSIVKSVIEMHGGKICAENCSDGYVKFNIEFKK
ncbi:MAG: HAMP domain-containing sensor histidine kinase [Clostridium sp.]|nr:HAMP domain-containing sensor histidine kinase [Clostridium sp.]